MTNLQKVGLLCSIDKYDKDPTKSKFASLYNLLTDQGINTELVAYSDDRVQEVEQQLMDFRIVLVWVNPINEGKNRNILDRMLLNLASNGVIISTHPNTILKLGTKDVIYQSRNLEWGCDVELYSNFIEFIEKFPIKLQNGPRVLKQYRGNGGLGIWRVELCDSDNKKDSIAVIHAERGSSNEIISFDDFYKRMKLYFSDEGHLIDQEYQTRLPEGMIRAYLCKDRVAGFGFQFVTALIPSEEPLTPAPREYFSKERTEFQRLRQLLETRWISDMKETLELNMDDLPLLWDADFLLGEKDENGEDTYVLCEINVSSVYPYPQEANDEIVHAIKVMINQ